MHLDGLKVLDASGKMIGTLVSWSAGGVATIRFTEEAYPEWKERLAGRSSSSIAIGPQGKEAAP